MKRDVAWLLLSWLVLAACRPGDEGEGEHHDEAAAFAVEHSPSGETTVVLSPEALEAAGIETAAPVARAADAESAAIGLLVADPARIGTLRAPFAGTIVAPDAEWPAVGAKVAAGAKLGMLAPRTAPLTTAEAADLASRLALARGEEKAMEAELAAASAALKRARELNELGKGVSDQAVEAASAAAAASEAKHAAAKASVAIFERAATTAGALVLEPIPLSAPREGEVVSLLVQPGESFEAGAELLRIADFRELFADVRLPPELDAATPPSKARVVVNGGGAEGRAFAATVVGFAPDGGALAPTLRLRVSDPSGALRPGLGVTAHLAAAGEPKPAIALPAAAVLRYASRRWIYVETEERHFARRAVSIVRVEGDTVLVAPLDPAPSKIVVVGAMTLLSQEQIAAGGSEGE